MKKYLLFSIIVLAAWWFLGSAQPINAATINAASCSQSAVQAAIDASSTGDIVSVPSGSCSWTSTVSIPSSKGITLQGAGIGNTNIVLDHTGQGIDLSIGTAALYRVTGFTFNIVNEGGGCGGGSCSCPITIHGDTEMSNWRVDNIRFVSNPQRTFYNGAMCVSGMTYGVFDHVTVEGLGRGWFFQEGYNSDPVHWGDYSWTIPINWGGPQRVFVEDSIYKCSIPNSNYCQVYDGRAGGRVVFRYNTVYNGWIEPHSKMGDMAGNLFNEIYENTFIDEGYGAWIAIRLRSGMGVIYNNTITDPDSSGVLLVDNRRACENLDGMCPEGYPCIDSIGRGPNQTLQPVYAWGNTLNGSPTALNLIAYCERAYEMCQENRDYYNTQKSGYVAYTYPHPLRGGIQPQTCGNNIREGTEACDGTDLAGQTCVSRGFSGGTLACNSQCSGFVTTACTSQQTCASQGYYCCPSSHSCSQTVSGTGCSGTCCASSNACTLSSQTPIAWWKFDDSGSTATDSSGNSNTGTLINGPSWTNGKIDGALSFDGANDYVNTTDSPFDFERTNSFSVAAWIKTSSFAAGERVMFSKETVTSPYPGWGFYVEPASLRVFLSNNWPTNSITKNSAVEVDDNAWHHVAFTYNGTSLASGVNVYVDGNLSNGNVNYDSLSASILNNQNLIVGAWAGIGNYFNGLIDDARIYNRVLSLVEIQTLYNAGSDTTPPAAPTGLAVR